MMPMFYADYISRPHLISETFARKRTRGLVGDTMTENILANEHVEQKRTNLLKRNEKSVIGSKNFAKLRCHDR